MRNTARRRIPTARLLVTATIGLAAIGLCAAEASASGLQSTRSSTIRYGTYGWIGDEAGSYSGNVYLEGVPAFDWWAPSPTPATFEAPGTMLLGTFITWQLPKKASVTLADMPFTIALDLYDDSTSDDGSPWSFPTPSSEITLSGVLNGTMRGDGTSDLTAEITSVARAFGTPPFLLDDLTAFTPQVIALPSPGGSPWGLRQTALYAHVRAVATPEPSALATIGLGIVAVGARTWLRRRRSATAVRRTPS